MTKITLKIALTSIALALMTSTASFATDATIYGSQLMTNQERIGVRVCDCSLLLSWKQTLILSISNDSKG